MLFPHVRILDLGWRHTAKALYKKEVGANLRIERLWPHPNNSIEHWTSDAVDVWIHGKGHIFYGRWCAVKVLLSDIMNVGFLVLCEGVHDSSIYILSASKGFSLSSLVLQLAASSEHAGTHSFGEEAQRRSMKWKRRPLSTWWSMSPLCWYLEHKLCCCVLAFAHQGLFTTLEWWGAWNHDSRSAPLAWCGVSWATASQSCLQIVSNDVIISRIMSKVQASTTESAASNAKEFDLEYRLTSGEFETVSCVCSQMCNVGSYLFHRTAIRQNYGYPTHAS